MIAQREQAERLVVVIGEDGAAVAIAAERLGGIEARRRISSKRTDLAPSEARAEALGRVADHEHAVRLGDLVDGIVVRRLAVEIDRDHATRLKSAFLRLADRGFEALDIHVESIATNIHEHRRSAAQSTATSTVATKVKAGTNTASPLPTPSAISANSQRIGAVGASHAMLGAAERSKLPLELGDLGSQDELAMLQHGGDRRLDAVAEMGLLCREVDKGRDGLRAVFTHAISHQSAFAHSSKGSGPMRHRGRNEHQASILVEFRAVPSVFLSAPPPTTIA